jgi:uncharacterized protein involved in exopolysaccharide biosynthesis
MAQLFRDQCRDAWSEACGWGLAKLWLRVAVDLVKSSTVEHLRNLNQREFMFTKAMMAFRTDPSLRRTFVVSFTAAFVVVAGACVLLTILAPEVYSSTARISVKRDASDASAPGREGYVTGGYDPYFVKAQFELIESDPFLGQVAKKLRLAESWGRIYASGTNLRQEEAIGLLRKRIDLRPVRNTTLIEIRAFSQNPSEAAEIANALAESYRELRTTPTASGAQTEPIGLRPAPITDPARIVDRAVPGLRPVRPNKPFNLFLGLFGGLFTASAVSAAGVVVVLLYRRFSRPKTLAA